MMARIIWSVLLLIIAVCTSFAQLDRTARYSVELSSLVPPQFQSFTAANLTLDALADGDGRDALPFAKRLLAERPMRQEHHRMFAQALMMTGEEEQAVRAIQRGALAGWRDSATQRSLLLIASAAQDDIEAARRLAALWALTKDVETLRPYAAAVMNRPEAQIEMARLLNSNPTWQAKYRREAPRLLDPAILENIESRISQPD